jgi:hypothetical protein
MMKFLLGLVRPACVLLARMRYHASTARVTNLVHAESNAQLQARI